MNRKEQISIEKAALEARLKVLEEAVKQKKKDDKAEMRRMKELQESVVQQSVLEKIREMVEKDFEGVPEKTSVTKLADKWGVTRESLEKFRSHEEGPNVAKKMIEKWQELEKK